MRKLREILRLHLELGMSARAITTAGTLPLRAFAALAVFAYTVTTGTRRLALDEG